MMQRYLAVCAAVLGVLAFSGCSKKKEIELPAVVTDYVKQLELIETALSRVQDVESAKECVRSLEAIAPASRLAYERYHAWSWEAPKHLTMVELKAHTGAVDEVDTRVLEQVNRIIEKPDLMRIVKPALKPLGGVISILGN